MAKLYETGVRLRNALYCSGLLRVQQLRQPVISVGNLTMGGTGKTPTVIALGQLLQASGYSVSVLLKGYKGQNPGNPLLVSDGKTLLTSSRIAGDEALVIARNLPGVLV
ncbi:MAG TPA: tetraacyldisaccharide 4'-kinase, partial [Nitrososphaera sp.]|nr:tetraacyldisaccharide 4'-kinase [Nitrososphaera sp.]